MLEELELGECPPVPTATTAAGVSVSDTGAVLSYGWFVCSYRGLASGCSGKTRVVFEPPFLSGAHRSPLLV